MFVPNMKTLYLGMWLHLLEELKSNKQKLWRVHKMHQIIQKYFAECIMVLRDDLRCTSSLF